MGLPKLSYACVLRLYNRNLACNHILLNVTLLHRSWTFPSPVDCVLWYDCRKQSCDHFFSNFMSSVLWLIWNDIEHHLLCFNMFITHSWSLYPRFRYHLVLSWVIVHPPLTWIFQSWGKATDHYRMRRHSIILLEIHLKSMPLLTIYLLWDYYNLLSYLTSRNISGGLHILQGQFLF